jgi:hypothetical protein
MMADRNWIYRNADVIALALIVLVLGIGAQAFQSGWAGGFSPRLPWREPVDSGFGSLAPEGMPLRLLPLRGAGSPSCFESEFKARAAEVRRESVRIRSEMRRALESERRQWRIRAVEHRRLIQQHRARAVENLRRGLQPMY